MSISRRKFVDLSLLSAASIVGVSLLSRPAKAQSWTTYLKALGAFASAVGSAVVAQNIIDYLKSLDQDSFKQNIETTNESLRGQGFADFSQSTVYNNFFNSMERMYYPLVYEQCGCQHFSAPYFDVTCGCHPITFVEGPHMFGLALSARLLNKRYGSQDITRDVLVPREGGEEAQGTPWEGYDRPLVYQSDEAEVSVDCQPWNQSGGTLIVKAHRSRSGKTILDERFDVAIG